jgi:hypothetical protein
MSDLIPNKIVLAVQGSFGHIDYATGILDAFRAHNFSAQAAGEPTLEIAAASGCVEMLTPLWLYLANQNAATTMRDTVLDEDRTLPLWAQSRLASPTVRLDAWNTYFSGLIDAQSRLAEAGLKMFTRAVTPHKAQADDTRSRAGITATADLTAALEDVAMYNSGLPGQIAFNPFFTAAKAADLEQLCAKTTGPTLFTNATRASDLQEVYLYCGAEPSAAQKATMRGKARRQVLRLTPEYFFASGARPPYIAPMPVEVDGKTQHWMEGAMRCNPPLSPLIDMDATHIVLIRFFNKDAREVPNNNTELNERFLDAIFSIPVQKEIENIKLNNAFAHTLDKVPNKDAIPESLRHRREVVILDPADRNNSAASPAYIKFLNEELNAVSHYDSVNPVRRAQMFDRGFQVGQVLIADLMRHLSTETRLKAVG